MTEEVKFSVQYDVSGVDRSIHSSQRLLYAVNALRLSIVDFQKLARDPSLGHLLWTGIQLTRTWRLLYNLVKATNQAQRIGVAGGVTRRALGVMGTSEAMTSLFNPAWVDPTMKVGLLGTLTGLATAHPYVALAALAITTVSALGYRRYFKDRRAKADREEFLMRQREIALSQGYEY